jgi:hypothetical protein
MIHEELIDSWKDVIRSCQEECRRNTKGFLYDTVGARSSPPDPTSQLKRAVEKVQQFDIERRLLNVMLWLDTLDEFTIEERPLNVSFALDTLNEFLRACASEEKRYWSQFEVMEMQPW